MGRTFFRTAVTAVCCAVVLSATGGTAAAQRPEPGRPHAAPAKQAKPKPAKVKPKATPKPRPKPRPTSPPVATPAPGPKPAPDPKPLPPRPDPRPDPPRPDSPRPDTPGPARPEPGVAGATWGSAPYRRPVVAPPPGPSSRARDTVQGVKLVKPSSTPVPPVEPAGDVLRVLRPTAVPTAADLAHGLPASHGRLPLWLLLVLPLVFLVFAAGIVLGRRRT